MMMVMVVVGILTITIALTSVKSVMIIEGLPF